MKALNVSRTKRLSLQAARVTRDLQFSAAKYSGMQKFGNPLQNLWKCE